MTTNTAKPGATAAASGNPGLRALMTHERLAELKASGVKRIVMLTGDSAATATAVAKGLGIDEIRADVMPEDKVAAIANLQAHGHRVAMIGDGINAALLGWIGPIEAAIIHLGPEVLVFVNSVKLLRVRIQGLG